MSTNVEKAGEALLNRCARAIRAGEDAACSTNRALVMRHQRAVKSARGELALWCNNVAPQLDSRHPLVARMVEARDAAGACLASLSMAHDASEADEKEMFRREFMRVVRQHVGDDVCRSWCDEADANIAARKDQMATRRMGAGVAIPLGNSTGAPRRRRA